MGAEGSPGYSRQRPTWRLSMNKTEFPVHVALDSPDASVIEANVCFYREIAAKYDKYEACVTDQNTQRLLNQDVDQIAKLLGPGARRVECLDCGGGTGNLSLKMLRKGWSVTVVDVSPDMLAILNARAAVEGHAPRLVNDSISSFLRATHESYDVVAFNSVLHHLYRYMPVVTQAVGRVRVGGIFYSNFDPVISQHPTLTRCMEALDTGMAKLAHDRSDLLPGTFRRLKKCFIKADEQHARAVASPGDLAEYHARTGVDDLAIVRCLEENGFSVQEHVKWSPSRTALTRIINGRLRLMQSFKILAQRNNVAAAF